MNTIVFGKSNDVTPQPRSFNGMPGWWTLPQGWFVQPVPGAENNLQVSPNADFSPPTYFAALDLDGTYVFQDTLANRMIGIDNGIST